jgi:hypothetical protein
MRLRDGNVDPASGSQIELIRSATGIACVQLWARVVLQLLADIDTGLRAIRAGPATNLDAAASRQQVVKDARAAAAWLFGPAAQGDRAWICGWIGVEPERLQKAIWHEHGHALDTLLTMPKRLTSPSSTA